MCLPKYLAGNKMNLFRLSFLLFILKWSAGKGFLLTLTVEIIRYQILIAKVL